MGLKRSKRWINGVQRSPKGSRGDPKRVQGVQKGAKVFLGVKSPNMAPLDGKIV